MEIGDVLRAARYERRLSQRGLAEACGMHRSVIDRIEAGRSTRPSIELIARILEGVGYYLVVVDGSGNLLCVTDNRLAPLDRGVRHFPAHLPRRRLRGMDDGWWGWFRIVFSERDPRRPKWTYERGPQTTYQEYEDARFNDAT